MADPKAHKGSPRGGLEGGILRNVRPFLWFFIALFLIQTLYSVLFLCVTTDAETVRREVTEQYDYELEYRSMTQPQFAQLYNQCGSVPPEHEEWRPYSSIRYEQIGEYYNAYVTLRGSDTASAAAYFDSLYPVEDMEPLQSPLYAYHAEYLPSIIGYTVACTVIVFAVSLFLLVRLYRARTDRDTFAFGIYMTYGATFSRLYLRAASELALIGALTILPAFLSGLLITWLLYAGAGVSIYVSWLALLLIPTVSLLTILGAVFIPIKRLSVKAPISLLSAKDNTPYVTSPPCSFNLFGAAWPRSYTLISLWRYRRYYALLLLSSVLLPVLFVLGCAFSNIQTAQNSAPAPDFTVSFAPKSLNKQAMLETTCELALYVSGIEGVEKCELESITTSATSRSAHLLLDESHTHQAGSVTVASRRTASEVDAAYTRATNFYDYTALDEAAILSLEARYFDIEGDLRSVLHDDHTVIITDSLGGTSPFRFSVGDVIYVTTEVRDAYIRRYTNTLDMLEQQLESGTFVYEQYTVGAVIHDSRPDDTLMLGVGAEAYRLLAGTEPTRTSFEVYLEDGLDAAAWQNASDSVYAAAFEYYSCSVENHHVYFSHQLTALRVLDGRTLLLSVSFCLMALLVSFYSQQIFYEKRTSEWGLLRAMGCTEQHIRRMFSLSAVVLSLVSLALTFGLSLGADALLCKIVYDWLPSMGFLPTVTPHESTPWSIVTAVAVSLLCTIVPTILAHRRAARQQHQMMGGLVYVPEKR